MAKASQEYAGILFHSLGWAMIRTKDGNVWRLDVDQERVRWLDGLSVRVSGDRRAGEIKVTSIVQA